MVIVYSSGRAFMLRKCVELALEERTETVSLLLRDYESSDADWLWGLNGNLLLQSVSPRFARAVGRAALDVEGKSLLDLLSGGKAADPAKAKALETLADLLSRRAPFSAMLVPITSAAGTRCIELSARPRYHGTGRFIDYRGAGSTVTEARQAAEPPTPQAPTNP